MDRHRLAAAYGLAISLLWGLSFLSIKVALRDVPPMTMAVARFVIACAALPLFARMRGERLGVALRDLPILAAGGITGVTLYFLGENHGVELLTASESSVIIGTIPVLTLLTERLAIGTRLAARTYAGALLSLAGVALIVGRTGGGASSFKGYLFMGVAALSWVAYSFLTRPVTARYGRLTITFWQMLFGLAASVPFALAEMSRWKTPGVPAVLNIFYLGLFCSAAGYWLYISALEILGPGRASVFINLIPVVAVAGAFLILGERLNALQLAGGAVAVAGVYLATMTSSRSETA